MGVRELIGSVTPPVETSTESLPESVETTEPLEADPATTDLSQLPPTSSPRVRGQTVFQPDEIYESE